MEKFVSQLFVKEVISKDTKCKIHHKSLKFYCKNCRELICFECNDRHQKEGCEIITILAYAKEIFLTDRNKKLEEFNKKKQKEIEILTKYTESCSSIKTELKQLKNKLAAVQNDIDEAIEFLEIDMNLNDEVDELEQKDKDMIVNLEKLLEGNKEESKGEEPRRNYTEIIKACLSEMNITKLDNTDWESEDEKIENIKRDLHALNNDDTYERLSVNLKDIMKNYSEIIDEYKHSVLGNYIYGLCYPVENYKVMCKYDVNTKKISQGITIPYGSVITQIRNRIFITGSQNPITDIVHEYLESSKSLMPKEHMKKAKCDHSTIAINDKEFLTIGGHNTWTLNVCEKYSIPDNKWTIISPLNNGRYWAGTAILKYRYVYAIGGCKSKNTIEELDLENMKEWKIIQLKSCDLEFDDSPAAFAFSRNEIMILKGSITSEVGVFDTEAKTVKKSGLVPLSDRYYSNSVAMFRGKAYVMGSDGNINIFNFGKKMFETISYAELKKNSDFK